MLDNLFSSVLTNGTFTGSTFALMTMVAFVCGLIIAGTYLFKKRSSKSFLITLILLPPIVELIILLVNGNLGAGVAVAGAFSLVRFRSVPGKGQEITGIFLAMTVGLASGMGYIGVALLFTVMVSAVSLILNSINLGESGEKVLKITVPENLDFEGKFENTFEKYLKSYTYEEVRTTNMGSLYKLTLSVILKENISTKDFLDEIRTGNGNLDVSLGRMIEKNDVL